MKTATTLDSLTRNWHTNWGQVSCSAVDAIQTGQARCGHLIQRLSPAAALDGCRNE